MRRTSAVILLAWLCGSVWAQDLDQLTFSEREISGTARYVAMGGAMAAVGGDVSAVDDNPAALGLFRRGEISITLDEQFVKTRSGNLAPLAHRFRMPQLSWVLSFCDFKKQHGVVSNSLLLQYERKKTFNRMTACTGKLSTSQTDLIATLTNGLKEEAFSNYSVFDDPQVGWLSVVGYDQKVIQPIDSMTWSSVLLPNELATSTLQVEEMGYWDEYTLGWGMNISNRVYVGLSARMVALSYDKTTSYKENFAQGGGYEYKTMFSGTGIGADVALGLVYRPLEALRLGLAFRSPQWMTMHISNTTSYAGQYVPVNEFEVDDYQLPMQVTAGVAYQYGTKGLLSFEYDFRHQKKNTIPDEHTFKLGGEYVINANWFVRLGYAFQTRFCQDGWELIPSPTETRTDTEYRNAFRTHYVSAGAGFRNRNWIIDLAYQCRLEKANMRAYYGQEAPFDLRQDTHRIIVSFGWTYR